MVFVFACSLLIADRYFHLLEPLKSSLLSFSQPLYEAVDIPHAVKQWGFDRLISKDDLLVENAKLESENLILRGKLQKLTALAIENVRLRELLNATSLLEENVLVAEIISVSSDPGAHFVVLNKGSAQGVFVGQAVIDANGLYGQVMIVAENNSQVILISDQRHAVPVQVGRNGLRLVVEGNNDFSSLNIPHVAVTTDIVEGDLLSTSGLGGLFPTGYPVAKVVSIAHDKGSAFAVVKATPFAHLDRSRYVLLLFDKE